MLRLGEALSRDLLASICVCVCISDESLFNSEKRFIYEVLSNK